MLRTREVTQAIGRAAQRDACVGTPAEQVPRRAEGVAAVVATSRQGDDALLLDRPEEGARRRRDLPGGVLHEDGERDPELLARDTVGLRHLRRRDDGHAPDGGKVVEPHWSARSYRLAQ